MQKKIAKKLQKKKRIRGLFFFQSKVSFYSRHAENFFSWLKKVCFKILEKKKEENSFNHKNLKEKEKGA